MFIPDSIDVNGISYTILQQQHAPDDRGSDWMGLCREQDTTIHINSTMAPEKKLQTIFHELVHAYLIEAGLKDHSEEYTQTVAAGMYNTFKQLQRYNPIQEKGESID